jgi:hypothetical protein
MPLVSDVFGGGGLLKAADVKDAPFTVTIDGWSTETIYDAPSYVIYFKDDERRLKLSPTCARDIAKALGMDDMASWQGGRVELYFHNMQWKDSKTGLEKSVDMIRARAPSDGSATTNLVTTPQPPRNGGGGGGDVNDEIPF